MTSVTVQLTAQEARALRMRTGKRSTDAALKAWIASADPKRSGAQLREALQGSMKEEASGKGRRFKSGREAVRWLES